MALPIEEFLDDISDYVKKHKVTMVVAPTGSGKSLGLAPALVANSTKRKVFISVPTVTAAKALYEKQHMTAAEVSVGFAADRDVEYDAQTQIVYVTSGHLRRKMLKHFSYYQKSSAEAPGKIVGSTRMADMDFCDILILDEIHSGSVDNSINIDLWAIAKANGVKVPHLVLSSATVDPESPLMEIIAKNHTPGIYLYEIELKSYKKDFYYEDRDYQPDDAELYKLAANKAIELHEGDPSRRKGHFLIFAPGAKEVESIAKKLYDQKWNNVEIVRLYSAMDNEEMETLYEKTPAHVRKFVIGTNIAESAITIPDVGVVIDTMTEKRPGTSESGGFRLDLVRISKSSATQRAGRTGRTRPGSVYRLITEDSYQNLEEQHVLDILVVPIHKEIMELLAVGLNPQEVLYNVPADKILQTIEVLQHLELLDKKTNRPTLAGYFVEEFSLSIHNAKIIWDYYQLGKNIFPAIVLASMIDSYGPNYFFFPRNDQGLLMDKEEREIYAAEHFSKFRGRTDLETFFNIWNQLSTAVTDITAKELEIRNWSNENSMNNKKVKEFYKIIKESVRISHRQQQREQYSDLICEVGDFSTLTDKILELLNPIIVDIYSDRILTLQPTAKKLSYMDSQGRVYALNTKDFLNFYGAIPPGESAVYRPAKIAAILTSEIKYGNRITNLVILSTDFNYQNSAVVTNRTLPEKPKSRQFKKPVQIEEEEPVVVKAKSRQFKKPVQIEEEEPVVVKGKKK